MPVSLETAQRDGLDSNVSLRHPLGESKNEPSGLDMDEFIDQCATLEDINDRIRRALLQHDQSDTSAGTSKASSIRLTSNDTPEVETPPGLTMSHCSTQSNGDLVATPTSASKFMNYFPRLAGFGKSRSPRISSPLGTDHASSIAHTEKQEDSSRPDENEAIAPEPRKSIGTSSETFGQDKKHPARARSASTSAVEKVDPLQQRQPVRSSSLPAVLDRGARNTWFHEAHPEREVVLPDVPQALRPAHRSHEDDIEALGSTERSAILGSADEKTESQVSSKSSIWYRTKAAYAATYCPSEPPPLILPTAPTDSEKKLYLHTNRLGLYSFGMFSFLSLSAGMWLFVISFEVFYWFGGFVALLQIYLIISYTVSMLGKDYDIQDHQRMIEENPIDANSAPTVDIYLPCCKEPIEVLENTYKHVQELRWPEGKLKVYVLDDGASETVQAMAENYGYNYICREDRPRLKKAGNLRWAFARTQGDFFAIFDADFCPRPDFLSEIMPMHLSKPDTAIVQTPQFFRIADNQTWVEQGAGAVQELFYRVVQVNRNRWGASICVGSNAVYRREALVEVGGTAEIGFSEDVHTGFYALTRGWKVRYMPLCLACGICPDTPRAFFSQQMRWCMGSTTLLTNMDFWRSHLTAVQKICYLSGMMYYSAISLSIFISPLPGILMLWVRPDFVRYYNLAFAIPSIFYSIIAMRCWAKASYGFNVQHVMVIQSYAYLTAIKDRIFGRALAWVPSGDTKAHKNNKYRNMRILAICWTVTILGLLIAGVVYQALRDALHWYDCAPLIALMTLNLYLSHRFLFWHGKV